MYCTYFTVSKLNVKPLQIDGWPLHIVARVELLNVGK